MIIQWCLKGIPARPDFGDADAYDVLTDHGLTANLVRNNEGKPLVPTMEQAHQSLSDLALVAHVNAYGFVKGRTPYLSLTAGVVERHPVYRVPIRHSAWPTALDFATAGGRSDGYVFMCWLHVPPKPGPELPGFAEEVRDLNLHSKLAWWNHEGEITAKLFVPPRQIYRVVKFDRHHVMRALSGSNGINPDFVPPDQVSNIRALV
jgi:hypothetical protein